VDHNEGRRKRTVLSHITVCFEVVKEQLAVGTSKPCAHPKCSRPLTMSVREIRVVLANFCICVLFVLTAIIGEASVLFGQENHRCILGSTRKRDFGMISLRNFGFPLIWICVLLKKSVALGSNNGQHTCLNVNGMTYSLTGLCLLAMAILIFFPNKVCIIFATSGRSFNFLSGPRIQRV
jgi:hypothetical protein